MGLPLIFPAAFHRDQPFGSPNDQVKMAPSERKRKEGNCSLLCFRQSCNAKAGPVFIIFQINALEEMHKSQTVSLIRTETTYPDYVSTIWAGLETRRWDQKLNRKPCLLTLIL